jgi:pimeloyl-ACP methyl ester carboxylesterase
MVRTPRSPRERSETSHRSRRAGGANYFTSTRVFDDLTVVVKRFPGAMASGDDYVLVHGIGVSSRYFLPLAAELAKRGRVWVLDLPGYGGSPKPPRAVSMADHADVVARFIREAGIERPVIVGHSMGCQVVARTSLRHPGLVRRVVLLAPTMPHDARTFGVASLRLLHDVLREPPLVNLRVGSDYFLRCGIPYMFRQLPLLLDDALEEDLPGITEEVTVVVGDRDPIVSLAFARECAEAAGGSWHVARGPHVVMHSDPVGVARLVTKEAVCAS